MVEEKIIFAARFHARMRRVIMAKKLASVLVISLVCVSIIAAGCSSTVTKTVNGGVVTLPGGVTTLPAVTVT